MPYVVDAIGTDVTNDLRISLGFVFLTVVTIEIGGWLMILINTGKQEATPFQRAFFRAGHAHAGALVTLGIVAALVSQEVPGKGIAAYLATYGVLLAAIVMPAGFFFSATGKGRTSPNALLSLVYLGAAILAVSVICLGIRLIRG